MNIFEALKAGKGKAVLPENPSDYCYKYLEGERGYGFIYWHAVAENIYKAVLLKDLERNDWEPYVPRETAKAKCYNCDVMKSSTTQFRSLVVTKQGNCYVCGKNIFPLPVKTKYKEVVEDVLWRQKMDCGETFAYPGCYNFNKFIGKGPTKVTVEWEGKV